HGGYVCNKEGRQDNGSLKWYIKAGKSSHRTAIFVRKKIGKQSISENDPIPSFLFIFIISTSFFHISPINANPIKYPSPHVCKLIICIFDSDLLRMMGFMYLSSLIFLQ